MYAKAAEFKAGMVILAALVALVAFLYFAGAEIVPWRDQALWTLRFEQGSVAPRKGDLVEMNGIVVGKIVRVEQAQELRDAQRILFVQAVLRTEPEQIIPVGTEGVISTNIAGVRTLALRPGLDPRNINPDDTQTRPILVRQSAGLASITGKLDDALSGVADTLDSVSTFADEGIDLLREGRLFLSDLRDKVGEIDTARLNDETLAVLKTLRESFEKLSTQSSSVLANIDKAAINAVALTDEAKSALADARVDVKATLTAIREASERVDRMLVDAQPKIDATLTSAAAAARSFEAASADLQLFAREIGGLGPQARGILDKFGVDAGLAVEYFKDAARNILDAAEEVRVSPWKLLNEPGPEQVANENLRIASSNYMRAMRDVKATFQALLPVLENGAPGSQEALQAAVAAFQRSLARYRLFEQRLDRAFLGPKRAK